MSKGPKWSQENVKALLLVVRVNLQRLDDMSDEALSKECGLFEETEGLIGKGKDIKLRALQDRVWRTAVDNGAVKQAEVVPAKLTGPVDADEQLEKVFGLLKTNGSATVGVIRKTIFAGNEKVADFIIDYGIKKGRISKTKTSEGTEVVTI